MPPISIPLLTHSSIQEVLDRNAKLLNHIKECQDNGWMDEAKLYQKRLNANLSYLGCMADATLNLAEKHSSLTPLQISSCNIQAKYKELPGSFTRMDIIDSLPAPIMTKVPEVKDRLSLATYAPTPCVYLPNQVQLIDPLISRSIFVSRLGSAAPIPVQAAPLQQLQPHAIPKPARDRTSPGSFLSPLAANVTNAPALSLFSDLNGAALVVEESDLSDEEYKQPEGVEEEDSDDDDDEEEEIEALPSDIFVDYSNNPVNNLRELPKSLLSAFHDDGSGFAATVSSPAAVNLQNATIDLNGPTTIQNAPPALPFAPFYPLSLPTFPANNITMFNQQMNLQPYQQQLQQLSQHEPYQQQHMLQQELYQQQLIQQYQHQNMQQQVPYQQQQQMHPQMHQYQQQNMQLQVPYQQQLQQQQQMQQQIQQLPQIQQQDSYHPQQQQMQQQQFQPASTAMNLAHLMPLVAMQMQQLPASQRMLLIQQLSSGLGVQVTSVCENVEGLGDPMVDVGASGEGVGEWPVENKGEACMDDFFDFSTHCEYGEEDGEEIVADEGDNDPGFAWD